MKMRPLGDRVLIRFIEAEEKVGGIIIPDTVKEKPTSRGSSRPSVTGRLGDDGTASADGGQARRQGPLRPLGRDRGSSGRQGVHGPAPNGDPGRFSRAGAVRWRR